MLAGKNKSIVLKGVIISFSGGHLNMKVEILV